MTARKDGKEEIKMRYFIYAKPDDEKNFGKIKLQSNGYYIENNGLYANVFTDSDNDFAEIPRVEIANEIIATLKTMFPTHLFELRKA